MIAIFSLPNTVFAWFEYFTSLIKIVALIIFLIVAMALVFGAGPAGVEHHGDAWKHGTAFLNGFKGFGSSALLAILAIGGMCSTHLHIKHISHVNIEISKISDLR